MTMEPFRCFPLCFPCLSLSPNLLLCFPLFFADVSPIFPCVSFPICFPAMSAPSTCFGWCTMIEARQRVRKRVSLSILGRSPAGGSGKIIISFDIIWPMGIFRDLNWRYLAYIRPIAFCLLLHMAPATYSLLLGKMDEGAGGATPPTEIGRSLPRSFRHAKPTPLVWTPVPHTESGPYPRPFQPSSESST